MRLTKVEKDLFLDEIESAYEILFGRFQSKSGSELKKTTWGNIATAMNCYVPASKRKTVSQWM